MSITFVNYCTLQNYQCGDELNVDSWNLSFNSKISHKEGWALGRVEKMYQELICFCFSYLIFSYLIYSYFLADPCRDQHRVCRVGGGMGCRSDLEGAHGWQWDGWGWCGPSSPTIYWPPCTSNVLMTKGFFGILILLVLFYLFITSVVYYTMSALRAGKQCHQVQRRLSAHETHGFVRFLCI